MPAPVLLPRLGLRRLRPLGRRGGGDGDVRQRVRGEAGDDDDGRRRRQLRRQVRRGDGRATPRVAV